MKIKDYVIITWLGILFMKLASIGLPTTWSWWIVLSPFWVTATIAGAYGLWCGYIDFMDSR